MYPQFISLILCCVCRFCGRCCGTYWLPNCSCCCNAQGETSNSLLAFQVWRSVKNSKAEILKSNDSYDGFYSWITDHSFNFHTAKLSSSSMNRLILFLSLKYFFSHLSHKKLYSFSLWQGSCGSLKSLILLFVFLRPWKGLKYARSAASGLKRPYISAQVKFVFPLIKFWSSLSYFFMRVASLNFKICSLKSEPLPKTGLKFSNFLS